MRAEAYGPIAAMEELFQRHADPMKVVVLVTSLIHLYTMLTNTKQVEDLLANNAHFPIGVSVGDRSH